MAKEYFFYKNVKIRKKLNRILKKYKRQRIVLLFRVFRPSSKLVLLKLVIFVIFKEMYHRATL